MYSRTLIRLLHSVRCSTCERFIVAGELVLRVHAGMYYLHYHQGC